MNINKEQAESIEFELPSILKGGMFSGAANLAIFKNHNEATSNTPSDYSNLSIKECEALSGFWRRRIE